MIWSALTLRDIVGIVFLIVVLGGLFVVWLISVNSDFTTNWVFWSGMGAQVFGRGRPVCIKRPVKTENAR